MKNNSFLRIRVIMKAELETCDNQLNKWVRIEDPIAIQPIITGDALEDGVDDLINLHLQKSARELKIYWDEHWSKWWIKK